MDATVRDNETWLADLRSDGAVQKAALVDLRDALVGGLRRALSSRGAVDDGLVEDAAQDALVRILDRLEQFQGRSRFVTWATSIAIRVAMSELRRLRWRNISLNDVFAREDVPSRRAFEPTTGPDVHAERAALLDAMHAAIRDELTERQRAALLAELKGMPQDEIARHLGSNRNAVYKLTHDARKRLKRVLEAAGYDAADVRATSAK